MFRPRLPGLDPIGVGDQVVPVPSLLGLLVPGSPSHGVFLEDLVVKTMVLPKVLNVCSTYFEGCPKIHRFPERYPKLVIHFNGMGFSHSQEPSILRYPHLWKPDMEESGFNSEKGDDLWGN